MKSLDKTRVKMQEARDLLRRAGLINHEEEQRLKGIEPKDPARELPELSDEVPVAAQTIAPQAAASPSSDKTVAKTKGKAKAVPTRSPKQIQCANFLADIERDHNVTLQIIISEDKMVARMSGRLARPWEQPNSPIYQKKVMEAIALHQIKQGLHVDKIQHLVGLLESGHSFDAEVIAEGEAAVEGQDAQVLLYFEEQLSLGDAALDDLDDDTYTTAFLDSDRLDFSKNVDHRQGQRINMARTNQVLAEYYPHVRGREGYTVEGRILRPREVDDRELKAGRNCHLNKDHQVIAEIDGQILFNGTSIAVSRVFHVQGNVDLVTGNIEFNGDVKVSKDVLSGFKIQAGGSILVSGAVENAELEAKGSITIFGGYAGGETGMLRADKSVRISHASGGVIHAAADLVIAKELINSTVFVGRDLVCARNSSVIGGKQLVKGNFNAFNLGSSLGVMTVVHMGAQVLLYQELKQLNQVLSGLDDNLDALRLSKHRARTLPASFEEKEKMRHQIEGVIRGLDDDRQGILKEIKRIETELLEYNPIFLRVSGTVYPGVKVVFCNQQFDIIEPLRKVEFYLHPVQQKICHRPLKPS